MITWTEITDKPTEWCKDGDLFLPFKAKPEDYKDCPSFIPMSGTRAEFLKSGFMFVRKNWMADRSVAAIIGRVRMHYQMTSSHKIRAWRPYTPRILPGNPYHGKPITLP